MLFRSPSRAPLLCQLALEHWLGPAAASYFAHCHCKQTKELIVLTTNSLANRQSPILGVLVLVGAHSLSACAPGRHSPGLAIFAARLARILPPVSSRQDWENVVLWPTGEYGFPIESLLEVGQRRVGSRAVCTRDGRLVGRALLAARLLSPVSRNEAIQDLVALAGKLARHPGWRVLISEQLISSQQHHAVCPREVDKECNDESTPRQTDALAHSTICSRAGLQVSTPLVHVLPQAAVVTVARIFR